MAQQGLFGGEEHPHGVGPAAHDPALQQLGAALPDGLYLGTSSWGFSGWAGLVYDRAATSALLSREGLAAYARHPLFRTVGVDRTHYRPMSAAAFAEHARQVPPGFRFLVKAHEHCTLARFPRHPRYGARALQDNDRFLDPVYARDQVVGPWLQGLAGRQGPLLFQFAPQDVDVMGGSWGFAERLDAFLAGLPRLDPAAGGPFYAVEVRNPALLTPAFADVLARHAVVPCLTAHGAMPDLRSQWRLAGAGRHAAVVVRWMLKRDLDFDAAQARYSPYDKLVDEDPQTRETIARLCAAMAQQGLPVWVVANNKAEGSSPLTLRAIAQRLVALQAGEG